MLGAGFRAEVARAPALNTPERKEGPLWRPFSIFEVEGERGDKNREKAAVSAETDFIPRDRLCFPFSSLKIKNKVGRTRRTGRFF